MIVRTNRGSRGQALAEFALVAPMFFVMLFFLIEGGRFIFYYEMLNNATREGTRYAIVHGSNAASGTRSGPAAPDTTTDDETGVNVMAAAKDAAIGLVATGDLSANLPVWWDCAGTPPAPGAKSTGNNGRGQCVTVFLDYRYSTIIPLLPPITISAESSSVINN